MCSESRQGLAGSVSVVVVVRFETLKLSILIQFIRSLVVVVC